MILTSYQFSAAGGRVKNEDCVRTARRGASRCFVLCDGLGGHAGGDLASQCVCDAMETAFLTGDERVPMARRMERAVLQSQAALLERQRAGGIQNGMRTTLCCLMLSENDVAAAFVGDSRIYQFRGGRALAHTSDHSVSQQLVRIGEIRQEDVRRHEDRSTLLRSMGEPWETPQYELWTQLERVQSGDAFLLCSDGLWEWVEEADMEHDLAEADGPRAWAEAMCARVAAREAIHAIDNYSLIAVWVQAGDSAAACAKNGEPL